MIPPGRGGLAGGTVIPSGNPLGVLRRDHHAVKRRVIASSLRERKPWLIKTRAEDALQPWSADRLREGNSDKKTNAEAGCTEPMAHNGSATQTTSHEWKISDQNVMVFCQWSPAGLVECRVLCLKRTHPKRLVVTPSRCEEPGFGNGG